MYLYRTQKAMPEDKSKLSVLRKGKLVSFEPEVPTELKEQIGYWRKANHIHGWFVDNVAGGEDISLKEHDVSREQLVKLLETVREVLEHSKLVRGEMVAGYTFDGGVRKNTYTQGFVIEDPTVAKQLLPTREGFFFGGSDYNQWYVDDLRYTRDILEATLASPFSEATFSYVAWW